MKFEGKTFKDPLYGNIVIEEKIILDLIDCKEVQRLRRIKQLSGVSLVFHTSEHSRFPHSLGAYEMARRVLLNSRISDCLSKYQHILLMCSALLHDVGHGPFSHAFENVFSIPHEQMSVNIIKSKDSEINKVLNSYDEHLVGDICDILSYKYDNKIISSLISSQIDVDRLDYLSRDSYVTGATYGYIDYNRLISTMDVVNNKLVFQAKGLHTIESYLMSRYHMYWQVYYHPTARSYEIILESIYNRIKYLKEFNFPLEADTFYLFDTLDNKNLSSYLELDDMYIFGIIKQLSKSKDTILANLCNRFINRNLFKHQKDIIDETIKHKFSFEELDYYYKIDSVKQSAYDTSNEIEILLENGELTTLSKYSNIVKGLIETSFKESTRVFYAKI